MDLISTLAEQGIGTVEVRRAVHDDCTRAVDEGHARMVRTLPAMDNRHRNAEGCVIAVLPSRTVDHWKMTQAADLAEHVTEPVRPAADSGAEPGRAGGGGSVH